MSMKVCRRCGETKSLELFKRDSRYQDGVTSFCNTCHQAASVAWQKANPEKLNASRRRRYLSIKGHINAKRREEYRANPKRNLSRLYKITNQQYEVMLAEQNGCCAICHRPASDFKRAFSVDHNHSCCAAPPTCGRCNRGLLCPTCNSALHSIERDRSWLSSAVSYLEAAQ